MKNLFHSLSLVCVLNPDCIVTTSPGVTIQQVDHRLYSITRSATSPSIIKFDYYNKTSIPRCLETHTVCNEDGDCEEVCDNWEMVEVTGTRPFIIQFKDKFDSAIDDKLVMDFKQGDKYRLSFANQSIKGKIKYRYPLTGNFQQSRYTDTYKVKLIK